MKYQLMLRPELEGEYTVFVPSLPGCITWGSTAEEARAMAAEAIGLYLQSLADEGEPIPYGDEQTLSTMVEVEPPIEAVHE